MESRIHKISGSAILDIGFSVPTVEIIGGYATQTDAEIDIYYELDLNTDEMLSRVARRREKNDLTRNDPHLILPVYPLDACRELCQ